MPPGSVTLEPVQPREPLRIAVVVSRYNAWITDRLLEGALDEMNRRLPERAEATVLPVPGSFEIAAAAASAVMTERFDAVVCLGCLIKGETKHDAYLATAVTNELARLSAETGVPVGFGVLTVDTPEQAEARAGGAMGNKGAEAMGAAVEMAGLLAALHPQE